PPREGSHPGARRRAAVFIAGRQRAVIVFARLAAASLNVAHVVDADLRDLDAQARVGDGGDDVVDLRLFDDEPHGQGQVPGGRFGVNVAGAVELVDEGQILARRLAAALAVASGAGSAAALARQRRGAAHAAAAEVSAAHSAAGVRAALRVGVGGL